MKKAPRCRWLLREVCVDKFCWMWYGTISSEYWRTSRTIKNNRLPTKLAVIFLLIRKQGKQPSRVGSGIPFFCLYYTMDLIYCQVCFCLRILTIHIVYGRIMSELIRLGLFLGCFAREDKKTVAVCFPCFIRNYKTREWRKIICFASLRKKQGGVKMSYVTWTELMDFINLFLNSVGVLIAVLAYFKNNKK